MHIGCHQRHLQARWRCGTLQPLASKCSGSSLQGFFIYPERCDPYVTSMMSCPTIGGDANIIVSTEVHHHSLPRVIGSFMYSWTDSRSGDYFLLRLQGGLTTD
jgi:hypothetical protein